MSLHRLLCVAATFAASVFPWAAAAAEWRALPGSENLEIDLPSAQLDRTRVTVWLRWTGGRLPLSLAAAGGAHADRAWRTSLLARFDCATRQLQLLAASGADRAGTPLFMSSLPGAPVSITQPDFAWAYDAVCEAARSARL